MELDLPNATFIVDLEKGVQQDPDTFRGIIEAWEGYDYQVGEIEVTA